MQQAAQLPIILGSCTPFNLPCTMLSLPCMENDMGALWSSAALQLPRLRMAGLQKAFAQERLWPACGSKVGLASEDHSVAMFPGLILPAPPRAPGVLLGDVRKIPTPSWVAPRHTPSDLATASPTSPAPGSDAALEPPQGAPPPPPAPYSAGGDASANPKFVVSVGTVGHPAMCGVACEDKAMRARRILPEVPPLPNRAAGDACRQEPEPARAGLQRGVDRTPRGVRIRLQVLRQAPWMQGREDVHPLPLMPLEPLPQGGAVKVGADSTADVAATGAAVFDEWSEPIADSW
eukprot:CAMPEP_0176098022 /NCGR_PEP_ID=MMETSP0120_2-20121206/49147_1 /TAXON_ID=160619 /ORGANISM="Kryptoperidinium foliaceum, Strain CCMP 1326" /LENGTH=290 /DNA_ID=CAMNT_0017432027 /DNA_START=65 /DNA_END=934 /DNA_ORIENTATION=+